MKKDALSSLLDKHHKDAFLWALQCCRYQEEDAKDVLQMVYLKIVEGKARYKEKSVFKTWLFSVIRFTAMDFLKKNPKFQVLEGIQVSQEAYSEENEINYRKLLLQLPTRQQQVLLLAFYHDMTLAEIAETTQLSIGTVRTHYERGKKALRELIPNKVT
ncbi:MAG: sigma-70 family RNA polymerase sigma factor [Bacteroidota bacterium]